MTNENDSPTPSDDSKQHSGSQSEPLSPAIKNGKIGTQPQKNPSDQEATSKELAREFRWIEFSQLVVNGVLAIIGVIALCIYHGQLSVMQGQLDEMQKGNNMERRRAEDQEEAVVRLHTGGMAVGEHVEQVLAVNSGKVTGRNIEGRVDISLNDADDISKKIRDLGSADFSSSELPGEHSLERQVSLSLTADDWRNLADLKMVIVDRGHIRYENGFGRVVDEPFCDGWWWFRTPSDKNNPIQGRGGDCSQIVLNVANLKAHPPH